MATMRPPPQSRVKREAAGRAVDSLLKWIRAQPSSRKSAAVGYEEPIYLVLTLTKTPHNLHSKPHLISLPHPLHNPSAVSLVVDDSPNSVLTPPAARDIVLSFSIPVSQILSISDLRSGILPSGELLFAERRVARLLHSSKKKKKKTVKSGVPVHLDFSRKSWPEYMRRVCFSTVLNLGPSTCNSIRVGRASQARDEIVDNVMAAVDGAVQNVPRKWSNVMALHLKMSESLALPIYQKSNWAQRKVDADEDEDVDGDDGREKRKKTCKGLEAEKNVNKEMSFEKPSRKRARAESILGGENSERIKKQDFEI